MPIIISPGQGLLLLIEKNKDNEEVLNRLKKLYLCGAENETESDEIKDLLKNEKLSDYEISYDSKIINDDPTRRYFETHLAYESLKFNLNDINLKEMTDYVDQLKRFIPSEPKELREYIESVLRGEGDSEYPVYIKRIKEGALFSELSIEDREKICCLVSSAYLGVVAIQFNTMPINIYGTGIYSDASKGKTLVQDQQTTRNQNLGLLKGHMPLALNDIARADSPLPYLKPSDQATFVEHANWVKINFDKLTHPFSNSISGTMLCQLRSLAKLNQSGSALFVKSASEMQKYLQLFTSSMLFGSGGHTLGEFTAPIGLDAVQKEFRSNGGIKSINLESMYLTGNEAGFNSALQDSINYNNMVLSRRRVHDEMGNIQTGLIDKAYNQQQDYSQRISSQYFSFLRVGMKKNEIVQRGLNAIIDYLNVGDHVNAKKAISELATELETKFRKKNIWGQESESYKLVKSIESEVLAAQVPNYKSLLKPAPTVVMTSPPSTARPWSSESLPAQDSLKKSPDIVVGTVVEDLKSIKKADLIEQEDSLSINKRNL